jgi:hypothetical protein
MSAEQDIPTPWIGTEDLPVHFANAFGVAPAPHAIFLVVGSVFPAGGESGAPPPYIPVRPIARLAIAPAAVPGLIDALQEGLKAHLDAEADA